MPGSGRVIASANHDTVQDKVYDKVYDKAILPSAPKGAPFAKRCLGESLGP